MKTILFIIKLIISLTLILSCLLSLGYFLCQLVTIFITGNSSLSITQWIAGIILTVILWSFTGIIMDEM